jgi:hypothetical protein
VFSILLFDWIFVGQKNAGQEPAVFYKAFAAVSALIFTFSLHHHLGNCANFLRG